MTSIVGQLIETSADQFSAVRKNYSAKVEKEANDVCEEVIALIDTDVLPYATDDENKAFFHKMYVRFLVAD